MADAAVLTEFLSELFPWDDLHKDDFKCVTAIRPLWNPTPEDIAAGRTHFTQNVAVKTLDEIVAVANAYSPKRGANLYIALGLQKTATTIPAKIGIGLNANRKAINMKSFNSIFMDIDVGPEEEKYDSTEEALQALDDFIAKAQLPPPNMMVLSGSGGVHVYWTTATPMERVTVWEPLAKALAACAEAHKFKYDRKCTIDAARVLRLPSTVNFKGATPTEVKLVKHEQGFEVAELQAALNQYLVAAPLKTGTGATVTGLGSNFTAGVSEQSLPPSTIDEIAVNCRMISDTLLTGGADKHEPDWNNDMFIAAWSSDPSDAAHRLSQYYDGYEPAAVDRKLAEKQLAIKQGGLGWIQCSAMNHQASCQGCPFKDLGKSPLNFIRREKIIAHPPTGEDSLMPPGYWRNIDSYVLTNTDYGVAPVFTYPIFDGGISTDGDLVIETEVTGVRDWHTIKLTKHSAQGISEAFFSGARILANDQKLLKEFAVAWMKHLQNIKKTVKPRSLGWHGDSFIYAGNSYGPTGVQKAFARNMGSDYAPEGDLKHWLEAFRYSQGNPAMEAVVATAFAAPLVTMVYDGSLAFSVLSHKSGCGKTTAMKTAQAVWALPKKAMSTLDDTLNYANEKLSTLGNLPLYWDELKTQDQMEKLVKVVFGASGGRSKGRLNSDSKAMNISLSSTMLVLATNKSVASLVGRGVGGTDAGALRVFEIEAGGLSGYNTDVEKSIIRLGSNYGVAGETYVKYLVKAGRDKIAAFVGRVQDQLMKECGFGDGERFDHCVMTTICAGAILANKALGQTLFDVESIKALLIRTYHSLKENRVSISDLTMTDENGADNVLGNLESQLKGRSLLPTDIVWTAKGPAGVGTVNITQADPSRLTDIWMQQGRVDGKVLLIKQRFEEWLMKQGYDVAQVYKHLQKSYAIKGKTDDCRIKMGTGTTFVMHHRPRCILLDPYDPPAPQPANPSHNPSSPSSNFGLPSPTTPAS